MTRDRLSRAEKENRNWTRLIGAFRNHKLNDLKGCLGVEETIKQSRNITTIRALAEVHLELLELFSEDEFAGDILRGVITDRSNWSRISQKPL